MCPHVRKDEFVVQGTFVLSTKSVAGEDSQIEVRIRGVGGAEVSWEWGSSEVVPGAGE